MCERAGLGLNRAHKPDLSEQRTDLAEDKISVLAPVGMAMLGCKQGEVVEWKVPDGLRSFRVDRIFYQPEAAGEYTL